MREGVHFSSKRKEYFDFASGLLYQENGKTVPFEDYQSALLYMFASNPDVIISSRQIVSGNLEDIDPPKDYYESITADSDNSIAREYIRELRNKSAILSDSIQIDSRFGYVYTGNKVMKVSEDWIPSIYGYDLDVVHEDDESAISSIKNVLPDNLSVNEQSGLIP